MSAKPDSRSLRGLTDLPPAPWYSASSQHHASSKQNDYKDSSQKIHRHRNHIHRPCRHLCHRVQGIAKSAILKTTSEKRPLSRASPNNSPADNGRLVRCALPLAAQASSCSFLQRLATVMPSRQFLSRQRRKSNPDFGRQAEVRRQSCVSVRSSFSRMERRHRRQRSPRQARDCSR